MKESSTKVRTPMFRSLILGAVLVITIIILVLAWFSHVPEANASGLTVKASSGLGLQTSWDGVTYQSEISRPITTLIKLPLITGNGEKTGSGINFFQPALNRTTGDPLKENGIWQVKNSDVTAARYSATEEGYTEGQYYEEDIYFSSPKELDVFLTQDSKVTPLDDKRGENEPMQRKSEYGEFSKDNIAGAVRVGIFKVDETYDDDGAVTDETETPIYTWIPNEKYELETYDNLIPITSTAESGETQSSFDPTNPAKTFGLTDTAKYTPASKYLGEAKFQKDPQEVLSSQSNQMYTLNGSSEDIYYGAVTIDAIFDQVDHGIIVSDSQYNTYPDDYPSSQRSFDVDVDHNSSILNDIFTFNGTSFYVNAHFDNTTFTYSNYQLEKLSVTLGGGADSKFFSTNDKFQILIQYSPSKAITGPNGAKTCLLVTGFVFYNDSKNSGTNPKNWEGVNGGAGEGKNIGGGSYTHYSITDGATVVISNKTSTTSDQTFGINAVATSTNAVKLNMEQVDDTDLNKTYIRPTNPLPSQLFKVARESETSDIYSFKSLSTGKYLAISGDKVVLQDAEYKFSLETGANGPMLKSQTEDKYISFTGRSFNASTSTDSASLEIYQGSSFSFTKTGNAEAEYKYMEIGSSGYTALANYKLTTDLSDEAVVTLKQKGNNPNSDYYGHIRVRIWIEGTDREAKIPLAGGKFATHLAFFGQPKSSTGA